MMKKEDEPSLMKDMYETLSDLTTLLDVEEPQLAFIPAQILPPKKRKSPSRAVAFKGNLCFRSSKAEEVFKTIHEAKLSLEEPTDFAALNNKALEELLSFNGLVECMEDIKQEEIFDKELTLTRRFNPNEADKIYLKDLTGVASVLIKLIDNCLCLMSTSTTEPSMIAQVAAFCILKRIKVDWVGLVMYNMTTVTMIPDGTRHYHRLISKLLGKYHLNLSLCRRSKICPLQHFTAASFKHKMLNQFHDSDKEEFEDIRAEIPNMKHILDAHIDMALLNTDTIMILKGLHANRDDFDLEVVRQINTMNQNFRELENQVKMNEARVRVTHAKMKDLKVSQELILEKFGSCLGGSHSQ
ncbi:hypothetical protein ZOSMA_61G00230 [Zostera marina]|uniref:Uncharacterized protein n=1 Tax=Zostera marina TaxID=29655 RepID=A0A0K9NVN2_ZOSMR|nr:hypothetical protein ZOSMA_61G00230 [Zostera marina]